MSTESLTRMAAGLFTTCGHRAIPVTSPLAPQKVVSVAHVIGFILKLEEILGCVILKLEEILGLCHPEIRRDFRLCHPKIRGDFVKGVILKLEEILGCVNM